MGSSLTGFLPIVNARLPLSGENLWKSSGTSCPGVPSLWIAALLFVYDKHPPAGQISSHQSRYAGIWPRTAWP